MERALEEAISRARSVYERVTGQPAPEPSLEAPYARIPPEVDREEHVLRQAALLFERVQELSAPTKPHEETRELIEAARAGKAGRDRAAIGPTLDAPVSMFREREDLRFVFDLTGVPRERVSVELEGATLRVAFERSADESGAGPQVAQTSQVAAAGDRAEGLEQKGPRRLRGEELIYLPVRVEPSRVTATLSQQILTVRVRLPALEDASHEIEIR